VGLVAAPVAASAQQPIPAATVSLDPRGATIPALPSTFVHNPPGRQASGHDSHGFLAQVAVGTAGSAAGMISGLYLGRAVCEVTSPCGGEDPGVAHAFVGILTGSVAGTAAGTALGARLAGVEPGRFLNRLGGAALGLLAGAAASQLVGGGADHVLPLVTFSLTQALVTTLLAPRPSAGAPR
jgi:hypothetical protein